MPEIQEVAPHYDPEEETLPLAEFENETLEIHGASRRDGQHGKYYIIDATHDGNEKKIRVGGQQAIKQLSAVIDEDGFPVTACPVKQKSQRGRDFWVFCGPSELETFRRRYHNIPDDQEDIPF